MRTLTVEARYSGIRIDKYLMETFPRLAFGALQKAFRKRDIKVNGTRVGNDYVLRPGDKLEVYIIDEILDSRAVSGRGEASGEGEALGMGEASDRAVSGRGEASGEAEASGEGEAKTFDEAEIPVGSKASASLGEKDIGFELIYGDDNILIVNKMQGLPVHPDRNQAQGTLIDLVRERFGPAGNIKGNASGDFPPALCHRLDQNTGGLVVIARNRESLDIITRSMSKGEVKKFYQCLVKGKMEAKSAELRAYLTKDERKSRVFINDTPSAGALEIVTAYRVLNYMREIDASLLEVELKTGRTHQIRAHLAHLGHPVLGDGKYGTNAINRPFGLKKQALWACRLKFELKTAGRLDYLKGAEFSVKPGFPSLMALKERFEKKLHQN